MWLLLKKVVSLLVMILYPGLPVRWLPAKIKRFCTNVLGASREARVKEMGSHQRMMGNNRESPIWPLFTQRYGLAPNWLYILPLHRDKRNSDTHSGSLAFLVRMILLSCTPGCAFWFIAPTLRNLYLAFEGWYLIQVLEWLAKVLPCLG